MVTRAYSSVSLFSLSLSLSVDEPERPVASPLPGRFGPTQIGASVGNVPVHRSTSLGSSGLGYRGAGDRSAGFYAPEGWQFI